MVLGLIAAVAAAPAIVGTTEAIRQGQRQTAREEHRGRRTNLAVTLPIRNSYSAKFDGALIVLKDNKLWVDVQQPPGLGVQGNHLFTGYYLPYASNQDAWRSEGWKGEGLVTTISDDPPFLNWTYIDRFSHEVKYGVRVQAESHLVGPWDCTAVDRRLTFEGWEGFIAVEEQDGSDLWALYFDRDDDGLRSMGRIGIKGKRMLAVEIWRREVRKSKDKAEAERGERRSQEAQKR